MENNQLDVATDECIELMEAVFRMQLGENVDFSEVMEIIRNMYKRQIVLINKLSKYEAM